MNKSILIVTLLSSVLYGCAGLDHASEDSGRDMANAKLEKLEAPIRVAYKGGGNGKWSFFYNYLLACTIHESP